MTIYDDYLSISCFDDGYADKDAILATINHYHQQVEMPRHEAMVARAMRRHNDSRLKRKRSKHHAFRNPTPTRIGKLLHTATPCSCSMCCNPRHIEKGDNRLTTQELRSNITFKEMTYGQENY